MLCFVSCVSWTHIQGSDSLASQQVFFFYTPADSPWWPWWIAWSHPVSWPSPWSNVWARTSSCSNCSVRRKSGLWLTEINIDTPWESSGSPSTIEIQSKYTDQSLPLAFKHYSTNNGRSSPSSSSTRGRWRRCRGTCVRPRRKPCRCRCGPCGSRPPEDARASYRSCPPGWRWVQSDDEISETSPAGRRTAVGLNGTNAGETNHVTAGNLAKEKGNIFITMQ